MSTTVELARTLDWNLLRTFVIVAQQGSITGASNELGVRQPTISMALQRLEAQLGHCLIDRAPGRFALTSVGQSVYNEASSIYGSIAQFNVLKTEVQSELNGCISVFSISDIRDQAWDKLLCDFFKLHPKATIDIEIGSTTEALNALDRGTACLAIVDGVIPARFSAMLMRREAHATYCGRGHPLFGEKSLNIEELRGFPFVGFKSDVLGGEHMSQVTALRAKASIGQFVRGSSAHVLEVQRMIESNLGFGILPAEQATQAVEDGRLWRLPPYENPPWVNIYAVHTAKSRKSATEARFIAELEQLCNQFKNREKAK